VALKTLVNPSPPLAYSDERRVHRVYRGPHRVGQSQGVAAAQGRGHLARWCRSDRGTAVNLPCGFEDAEGTRAEARCVACRIWGWTAPC
jgi:hypothetical protein